MHSNFLRKTKIVSKAGYVRVVGYQWGSLFIQFISYGGYLFLSCAIFMFLNASLIISCPGGLDAWSSWVMWIWCPIPAIQPFSCVVGLWIHCSKGICSIGWYLVASLGFFSNNSFTFWMIAVVLFCHGDVHFIFPISPSVCQWKSLLTLYPSIVYNGVQIEHA